jgi:branched-chain amino acid transport system ATP-binding protein
MLHVDSVWSGYGFSPVLRGISLHVNEGEFVALLGPNGAGKSTTLRTIAGLLHPHSGEIAFRGRRITRMSAHGIVRLGVGLVSESLNLFTAMSVYENLLMGGYSVRGRAKRLQRIRVVFEMFPQLLSRRHNQAGTLSGGERKMLAIGRALMSEPALLLIDEPSLGLSPKVASQVFRALSDLHLGGHTILLVEQDTATTLNMVDRAYVLEQGVVVLEGLAAELRENPLVREAYLGVA